MSVSSYCLLYMGTRDIKSVNQSHWPCWSLSILRPLPTYRVFEFFWVDYILLIWSNSLRSVSRDRALGTKWKIPAPLRSGERNVNSHNIETFIRFRWPCRSLSIWRGFIFHKFRTPWPWLWPWIWEKISVVHHSSTFTHIDRRRKSVDGRSIGQRMREEIQILFMKFDLSGSHDRKSKNQRQRDYANQCSTSSRQVSKQSAK